MKEFEKGYFADKDGNIYSNRKFKEITLLKQYKDHNGYLRIKIINKTKKVHRLIAKTFIPNKENKSCVNHKDGNKSNNKISNLEWCTRSENSIHAYSTGLIIKRKGTRNKSRIGITKGKAKKFYELNRKGYSLRRIGKIYGFDHHTIDKNIKKHLESFNF